MSRLLDTIDWELGAYYPIVGVSHGMSMRCSDGKIYTAYERNIKRGGTTIYTWPYSSGTVRPVGYRYSVSGYNDWFYFAEATYTPKVFWGADGTMYARVRAYNPVTGTAVTIRSWSDGTRLTDYISPDPDLHDSCSFGLDPVSGYGLCCRSFYITSTLHKYSQCQVVTFTLGTPSTSPAYAATPYDQDEDGSDYFIDRFVSASAYNGVGLFYRAQSSTGGDVYRIPDITYPGAAVLRSGVTLLGFFTGPNLFVDSANPSLIRNSAGLTWDIAGTSTYVSLVYLGSDDTCWYVGFRTGETSMAKYIAKLLKTGTTVTLLKNSLVDTGGYWVYLTTAVPGPYAYYPTGTTALYNSWINSSEIKAEQFTRFPGHRHLNGITTFSSKMADVT